MCMHERTVTDRISLVHTYTHTRAAHSPCADIYSLSCIRNVSAATLQCWSLYLAFRVCECMHTFLPFAGCSLRKPNSFFFPCVSFVVAPSRSHFLPSSRQNIPLSLQCSIVHSLIMCGMHTLHRPGSARFSSARHTRIWDMLLVDGFILGMCALLP